MIKHISQAGARDFRITSESEQEKSTELNMITGKHLMEVYFHVVPVFRYSMGMSKLDDMLCCRIYYQGDVAYISQSWASAQSKAMTWPVTEVFASNSVQTFCEAFKIDVTELSRALKDGKRDIDAMVTKAGITKEACKS